MRGLQQLWNEPWLRPAMAAYKYEKKCFAWCERAFSYQDWEDVLSHAIEHGVLHQAKPPEQVFILVRRAVSKEIRYMLQTVPRHFFYALIRRKDNEPLEEIPILSCARMLYRALRKKGVRGRRSAAEKAYIIQQRLLGKSFKEISISMSAMNTHHQLTMEAAKRSYYSALALLLNQQRGNITRGDKPQKPRGWRGGRTGARYSIPMEETNHEIQSV